MPRRLPTCSIALGLVAATLAGCSGSMLNRLANDREVLREFQVGEISIPPAVLRQSKAVLVLDTGGGGTLVRNLGDGRWSAPLAMSVVAGSLGLQIGGEGRSVVMILNDESVLDRILSGDPYPLAGAAAVAGPAAAEVAYDSLAVPSVYTYSRTAGLFVGAMVGGMGITIDKDVNGKVYGDVAPRTILSGSIVPPAGGLAYAAQLDTMAQWPTSIAIGEADPTSE
jgi:lipid-binding SYLF domain-containing protein